MKGLTDHEQNAVIAKQVERGRSKAPKVDTNSETWKAIVNFVEEQHSMNFMSLLRNRNSTVEQLHYANGGLDCLESLLQLGGSFLATEARKPPQGR